jgi:hypothetical protein
LNTLAVFLLIPLIFCLVIANTNWPWLTNQRRQGHPLSRTKHILYSHWPGNRRRSSWNHAYVGYCPWLHNWFPIWLYIHREISSAVVFVGGEFLLGYLVVFIVQLVLLWRLFLVEVLIVTVLLFCLGDFGVQILLFVIWGFSNKGVR